MKNNVILYLLLIFIVFSCNKKEIRSYHDNGNLESIKEYYKEELQLIKIYDSLGTLNRVKFFNGKRKLDSLIDYTKEGRILFKKIFNQNNTHYSSYKNEIIQEEGFLINDTLKTGWWKYFNNKGVLKSKREYVLLCDDYYLNQSIIFDKDGDTIYRDDDFNESIYVLFDISEKDNDSIEVQYEISPISYRSK